MNRRTLQGTKRRTCGGGVRTTGDGLSAGKIDGERICACPQPFNSLTQCLNDSAKTLRVRGLVNTF